MKQTIYVTVEKLEVDGRPAHKVTIGGEEDEKPDYDIMRSAAGALMNIFATLSPDGYEKALEDLVQHTISFKKQKIEDEEK